MSNPFEGGVISLTFDDGWLSVYTNALPFLEREGIVATHYIIGKCLDDKEFPKYMNVKHLRELQELGHEIGCHTVSHKHLADEAVEVVTQEIAPAKHLLEEHKFIIDTFAYPYGEYNDSIVAEVRKAGFVGARSVIEGFNDTSTDKYLLRCQAVKADTKLVDIEAWIRQAKESNTWLILMFHQIDASGSEWSSTQETLAGVLGLIHTYELPVLTVKEALGTMGTHA
jgi:peptidoglycan/xylan/chitin deacetylase (PgdA/CDA1 family)